MIQSSPMLDSAPYPNFIDMMPFRTPSFIAKVIVFQKEELIKDQKVWSVSIRSNDKM